MVCVNSFAKLGSLAMYAPIVLFVFNRPTHTRRTVEALKRNTLSGDSDLIIFSDGPRDIGDVEAVDKVREYISSITGFKSVTIVRRDKNWGLANSIIDGVTSVVNERGRIIVLEDDLIATPHFLGFMNRALDKYRDEGQVIQVSGYMFPVELDIKEDSLFLPLTTSWGWATWKRAWKLFDPDAKGYSRLKGDSNLRRRFNLDGAYDYFSMLEAQLAGRIDSWAVRWQLSAFLNNALVIYPRRSLIVNAGFGGEGTHGKMQGLLSLSGAKETFSPIYFPREINPSDVWGNICRAIRNRFSLTNRVRCWIRLLMARFIKGEEVSNCRY